MWSISSEFTPNPTNGKTFKGYSPTFWLYDEDLAVGNAGSEIDIFEINAYKSATGQSNIYTNNVHYQRVNGAPYYHMYEYDTITSDVWHTSGVNWTANNIEFYYDGVKINEYPNHPDSLIAMPIFVVLGAPAGNFCENIDTVNSNGTYFPYKWQIDYVKVWQLKTECDTARSYCNFNPTNYNSKLYKSVTLGGSNCNASIINQPNFNCIATDYILLNEGFSIDNQSNAFFNVTPCQLPTHAKAQIKQGTPDPPPVSYHEK